MAQVESVDFPNKRIYLHADTVSLGFDVIAAHFEIKNIVFLNAGNEQNFSAAMTAEGNISKGNGTYTARFGLLEPGWRLVPYDGVAHNLDIKAEIISLDGLVDRDVFDRSTLPAGINVNIDPVYEKIEIREVATAGGLGDEDRDMLRRVYQRLGLDTDNPVEYTDAAIRFADIVLAISNPDTDTTLIGRE